MLDGKAFASAGPYERIAGKAYFAVDPNLPANKIIADIAKAPRNDDGLVEFSADFDCLKPRDPQHGNHAVLFEVSNRGGKGMLSTWASFDPRTAPISATIPAGAGLHAGLAGLGIRCAARAQRAAALCAGGRRASRDWCAPKSRWITRTRGNPWGPQPDGLSGAEPGRSRSWC